MISEWGGRGDRAMVLGGLACLIVVAWLHLLRGAGVEMRAMGAADGQMMDMMPVWAPGYVVRVAAMWTAMMVAMALPAAVPAIMLVTSLPRRRPGELNGARAALLFATGSLVVWTGFSVTVTLAQWGLDRSGVLSDAMASRGPAVSGLILLAAGLYQFTPLKDVCLLQCRSPREHVLRASPAGALATIAAGVRYGAVNLGCCGPLMGLMFVGGVMNVSWTAGLTLLVLAEQALPWAQPVHRITGAAFLAWGSLAIATAIA
jgi:predicted metal-binding membrane protein